MKKARARRMTGHCVLTETDSTFTDSKVEIPCTGEVISGKMVGTSSLLRGRLTQLMVSLSSEMKTFKATQSNA